MLEKWPMFFLEIFNYSSKEVVGCFDIYNPSKDFGWCCLN